jgi:hypothetical protein
VRDARGWELAPCGNDDCTEPACPMPPEGAVVSVTVCHEAREVGTDWPEASVFALDTATVDTQDPPGHQVIAVLEDGRRVWLSVDDLAPVA